VREFAELERIRANKRTMELESSKAGGVSPRSQCGAKNQFERDLD
jgi:hypothetical protein